MRAFTILVFICAALAVVFTFTVPHAKAQVGVEIGVAPDCPYGYFDVAPYDCAPAGYYGPEWFNDGIFIGAGPWFHGHAGFHGYVNNTYHPAHGYKGHMPARGERPEPSMRVNASNFHGNEMRDGRGHTVERR